MNLDVFYKTGSFLYGKLNKEDLNKTEKNVSETCTDLVKVNKDDLYKTENYVAGILEGVAKVNTATLFKTANYLAESWDGVTKINREDLYKTGAYVSEKCNELVKKHSDGLYKTGQYIVDTVKSEKAVKMSEGFVKATNSFYWQQGKNYKILIDSSRSCKVSVLNKIGNTPIFRLDSAHTGPKACTHNHINLNPKFSNLKIEKVTASGRVKIMPYDPHYKLPTGTLTAGKNTARLCKAVDYANDFLFPIVVFVDTARIGYAGYQDYQNGTTRNTMETTATVAGGWVGGYGGCVTGAAIGSAILPGAGTIVGGLIGGLSLGITGAVVSASAAERVGDYMEYNIEHKTCNKCQRSYVSRKYKGEDGHVCELKCNVKYEQLDPNQSFY